MWDFDGDEWAFLAAAAIFTGLAGVPYWFGLAWVEEFGRRASRRAIVLLLPVIALAPTLIVLRRWADPRVAGHLDYVLLFLVGGAAWLTAAARASAWLGVSIRDDAVERDNPAALLCACALLVGVGLVYALSNVGAGPTIWTTLAPALVSAVLLVLTWLAIEGIGGGVAEAVTIDRDVASGVRMLGAMLAIGLVLGRAAGGAWVSWPQTWADLGRFGWPAMPLALAAGLFQRLYQPTARVPRPGILSEGIAPAGLFLLVGLIAVDFTPNAWNPARW